MLGVLLKVQGTCQPKSQKLLLVLLENAGKVLKGRKGFKNAGKVLGKVLKLWERFYRREKVGKVSKFQERLYNDNFKAGNGEERKGKGKLSVPP